MYGNIPTKPTEASKEFKWLKSIIDDPQTSYMAEVNRSDAKVQMKLFLEEHPEYGI